MILFVSSIAFPPFYSVNLESRGTIDSLVLFPVYQSLLCVHHPEGRAFPCFSFFSSFWCCFFESPWLTFLFWSTLVFVVTFLWFNFWPSFLFVIFPEWAESNSVGSKVFCCYFLFYSSLLWFPEVLFLCIVRGYSRLSPFSCWISDTWEGRICHLFLVFFLALSFKLS